MRTPKVVFLGHSATRSGAPIALLHLLTWLRRETEIRAELLLLEGGPLVPAYSEVLPTSVVGVPGRRRSFFLKVIERSGDRLTRREPHIPARLPQLAHVKKVASRIRDADLLYVNSFGSASVLHELRAGPPVVLHVHEMSYGMRHEAHRSAMRVGATEDEYLRRTLHLADAVIVPSEASRKQLAALAPSVEERCHVIPGGIDINAVRTEHMSRDDVRKELGIPVDSLVVVACGRFDWVKATDLFVQVAARVIRAIRSQPVHFVWVGAPSEPALGTIAWRTRREFEFDLRSLGLQDRVVLVPPTPHAAPYLGAGDVFLLPSREDPFPLVAIEAAALGRPVVCFESSGTAEMVGSDAGAVVPHLDVLAMATAVQRLLENRPARLSAGEVGAARVEQYDVSRIAPRVLAVMDRLIRRHSGELRRNPTA